METLQTEEEASETPRNGETLNPEQDEYRRKFLVLKRKCDSIEDNNKRLLNRVYHVRKTISRLSRERRGLMSKLDELKDTYKSAERTTPLEDGPFMQLLGFADATGRSANIKPAIDPRTGFAILPKAKVPRKHVSNGSNFSRVASRKKKSKHGIKREKEKDPNAPKKPANAFLMFCQEKRASAQLDNVVKRGGEMSHSELTKQLAMQWNDLDQTNKKRFYAAYEKQKIKYIEDVRQYAKGVRGKYHGTTPTPATTSHASKVALTLSQCSQKAISGTELTQALNSDGTLPLRSPLMPTKVPVVKSEEVDPYSFDGD